MKNLNEKFMQLLQLADSALPTGGYAFSNGLESAASLGIIRNTGDLERYLVCYLEQVCDSEMPFLSSCFKLNLPFEEQEELFMMIETLDAFILVPKMHDASLVQGKNYFRIFATLFPEGGIKKLKAWFSKKELNPHSVVVFGLGMKAIGYTLATTKSIYYYIALRDQLSAAIRLSLIGPMEGSAMQKNLSNLGNELISSAPENYTVATKRAPLTEILQGIHCNLYSRIFQT